MKTPAALQPVIDDGVIDEVIRSLKSGKEATVYLVRSGVHTRCATVYRNMPWAKSTCRPRRHTSITASSSSRSCAC